MNPSTIDAARSQFPHIPTGLVYLNHASRGPLPSPVVEAVQRHLTELSVGPIDTYLHDRDAVDALRAAVARLVNAPSPDRIAFAQNTSVALNVVASGLPWRNGDHVLLNEMEFPANVYPYLNLKRHGVLIDTLSCPDGRLTVEMIEKALTPSTRAVALSAVQFLSGYRSDLASIGSLCRSKNVLLLVDGIQAIGGLRVDVQAMHIDALGCGAQKWLLSPHGTGFLDVSEPLQERIHQSYLGWLSAADPWNFRNYGQPLAKSAKRYEGGTLNFPGLLGMAGAVRMLEAVGAAAVEERVLELSGSLVQKLEGLDGVHILSPRGPEERSGIVTVRPGPPERSKQIFERLLERKIVISLREGLLRFSPHFYNTEEELDASVSVMKEMLR